MADFASADSDYYDQLTCHPNILTDVAFNQRATQGILSVSSSAEPTQAYKVHRSSVFGMLNPIQCMEYYLSTGHSELATFFGGKDVEKQGLCHGNVVGPLTWQ